MVIGIFGENCSGKTTLAGEIKKRTDCEVVTGKDYLRMAKSESEARTLFLGKLHDAEDGRTVVYVIADREDLSLLPGGAKRIYVKADLETIKARFTARMRGVLPPPVEAMLERKHGLFENEAADAVYDGAHGEPAAFCDGLEWLR